MNHDKRSVTLEDLLRLKRSEQPPPEFWTEFDRQLRAKQLAALVEKRPWWHGIHDIFAQVRRFRLPLGAAAALAVTFIVLRDDAPSPSTVQPVARTQVAAVASATPYEVPSADLMNRSEHITAPARALEDEAVGETSERFASVSHPERVIGIVRERPADAPGVISPFEAITASRAVQEEASPSARFIAANFAAAQAADTVGPTLLPVAQGFESRALPARSAMIEPLQQMTPPGEARRSSRYLATMVSTTVEDTSTRTSERVANRISADELYDQVRRFGARRGGFNVKF